MPCHSRMQQCSAGVLTSGLLRGAYYIFEQQLRDIFHLATMDSPISPLHFDVSKQTLMFTSLVYHAPQLEALDTMISAPSSSLRLPIEIILLIRLHLFPILMTETTLETLSALSAYELSLPESLCPDCLTYQLDVYGADIWQWQQNQGFCKCTSKADFNSPTGEGMVHFSDQGYWLENYLSCEVRRLRRSVEPLPEVTIGDAVSAVIETRGFELWPPASMHGYVQWFDVKSHLLITSQNGCCDPTLFFDLQQAKIILSLYFVNHTSPNPALIDEFSTCQHSPNENICDSSFIRYPTDICIASDFVQAMVVIITAPLTFATTALRVMCFYSRPSSFRIYG